MLEAVALILFAILLGVAWSLRSWHYRQQARQQLLAQPEPQFEATPRRRYIVSYQRATWYQPLLIAGAVSSAAIMLHWKTPIVLSLACLAGAVAVMVLGIWKERRHGLIESQLADAIDVMIGAVRAGSSSTGALEAAAKTARQPLRAQLDTVLGRIRLGDNTREVVNDMARNVPLETFRLFAFTFGVHWEAGGSLAPALRTAARTIRDRIEVSRRMRAQTSESTASLIGITCIVYAFGYVMWKMYPQRLEGFIGTSIGTLAIAGAILFQAIGFLWVGRLMRFKY